MRCLKCIEKVSERNKIQWKKVTESFTNIPEKRHRKTVFRRFGISDRLIPRPDGVDKNGVFVELKKAMPRFVHGSFTKKSKYFPELYFKKHSTEWDSEFVDKQIEADVRFLKKIRVIVVKANELGKVLEDKTFP